MALHVVVATYKDALGAQGALDGVKAAGIKLEDSVYILNNGDGDLEFKEAKDAGGGRGFAIGGATVAVAGLLLGPVGWGALAAGGVVGGLISKLHDANIPSSEIERLGAQLKPGEAAAIAVTKDGDEDAVRDILFNNGGEIVSLTISDDLKTALDDVAQEVEVAEDGTTADSA